MEDYGFVRDLTLPGSKVCTIFVKKIPDELTKFDLCPAWQYNERYYRPSPNAIGPTLRRQLIDQGLVIERHLQGLE